MHANNPIKYTDPDGRYIPELEANPSEEMYNLLAERDKDGDECPECEPGTMLNTVQVTADKEEEIPLPRLPENDPPTVSLVGAVPVAVAVAPEAVAVGAVLWLAYYLYTHPVTVPIWVYNKDNSKNEKHGDGGRKMSKSEKQIRELEKQLEEATGNSAKQIRKTIQNIREAAKKAAKGEEHSKSIKR